MKFVAEYLENTSQILLRLLSAQSPSSDIVQLGTYIVDATPKVPEPISFDLESDAIKNGEAHVYLTGFWPLPDLITITLPDSTKQKVKVVTVVETREIFLADQPMDALTPIEPEIHRPGESENPYKAEKVLPPDYPSIWVELSLERSDPLRLGLLLTSDTLTYAGGGAERALSATQKQVAVNVAPYLSYAPVRLEGSFGNSLTNAELSFSHSWPSPYFDPMPAGWSVNLADPMDLIRLQTDNSTALPSLTLRYRQRSSSFDNNNSPPVTMLSPAVTNAGETFQAIFIAGASNLSGKVQLKTADGIVSSPLYPLSSSPLIATLPVGSHTGRVQIIWDQLRGEGAEQILQMVAPCSSLYKGSHSWLPYQHTTVADILTVNNIVFPKNWFLYRGTVRVDGQGDNPAQPYSWEIKLGTTSFLKVDGGILSSDYASASVLLSDYSTSLLKYKLTWSSPSAFSLIEASEETKVTIPFTLDLSSVDLTLPLTVTLKGFKIDEGSSIAKRWAFTPI